MVRFMVKIKHFEVLSFEFAWVATHLIDARNGMCHPSHRQIRKYLLIT